jgi:hypothetical protein
MPPRLPRLAALVLVAAPFVAIACHRTNDGDTISSDGTQKPKPKPEKPKKTKEPSRHRAKGEACAPGPTKGDVELRDAGTAGPTAADARAKCKADADCTAGKNGRCAKTGGGRLAPHADCVYDACFADSDCPAKSACVCGGGPGRGNYCMAGNCATDAECGGSYCSPTFGTSCGPYGGYAGNYCHTSDDECTDDDDCGEKKGQRGYCAWFPEAGHWKCGYNHCVG